MTGKEAAEWVEMALRNAHELDDGSLQILAADFHTMNDDDKYMIFNRLMAICAMTGRWLSGIGNPLAETR